MACGVKKILETKMTVLSRDDWYDIARDVDWTISYVDEKEAFPDAWTGCGPIPKQLS